MRKHFLAKLSIVLIASSLFLFIFQDEIVVFNAMAMIMSIEAILLLIHMFRNIKHTQFSTILALSLLLGYGVGTFNSAFNIWLQKSMSVAEYFNYQPSQLSIAQIVICLSVSMLLWISKFERSIFKYKTIEIKVSMRDIVFVSIITMIVIYAFATAGIGFQGVQSTSTGQMSVIGAIASMLHPAIFAYAIYCFQKARGGAKIYFGVIAALMLVLLIPQGRRIFLYSSTLSLFAYMLAGGRFQFFKIKTIILLVAIIIVSIFATDYFFAMRLATYGFKASNFTLWELVNEASAILFDNDARDRMQGIKTENIMERTFILGYLSILIDKIWTIPPLYGQILWFSLQMAIPSILSPGKSTLIEVGYEEAIANPHFGLPVFDIPNTILTSGISDFGILGAFLYPLLLLVMYKWARRILYKFAYPTVSLIGLFILIYSLLQVEEGFSFYFVSFRDLLLSVLLMSVIYRISDSSIRISISAKLRHKKWLQSASLAMDRDTKNNGKNIFR